MTGHSWPGQRPSLTGGWLWVWGCGWGERVEQVRGWSLGGGEEETLEIVLLRPNLRTCLSRSPGHSFIQQAHIEHALCARCCVRHRDIGRRERCTPGRQCHMFCSRSALRLRGLLVAVGESRGCAAMWVLSVLLLVGIWVGPRVGLLIHPGQSCFPADTCTPSPPISPKGRDGPTCQSSYPLARVEGGWGPLSPGCVLIGRPLHTPTCLPCLVHWASEFAKGL